MEISKTFFARRGLWIYLLALLPVLIFGGHAWDVKRTGQRRMEEAKATPGVTATKMSQIQDGMTRQQVVSLLGEPSRRVRWDNRRGNLPHLRR